VAGTFISSEASIDIVVVSDTTLEANFSLIDDPTTKYTVTLISNPLDAGILTGAGKYDLDDVATLTATANSN